MRDNTATRRRRNASFYQVSSPGFYGDPKDGGETLTVLGPRYPRSAFAY